MSTSSFTDQKMQIAFGNDTDYVNILKDSSGSYFNLKRQTVNFNYQLEKKGLDWKKDEGMCYTSNELPRGASPSLRKCFHLNSATCCNYLHDSEILDDFAAIIPEPCQGNFPQVENFVCLPCQGKSHAFFKQV